MKKALKILGITILILLIVLVTAPFLFKGKIESLVKENINKQINATVSWNQLDLSLIKGFPSATLGLQDLSIINNTPFENDTLVYAKNFSAQMGIMQLFKSEGISLDEIRIDNALINAVVNEDGIANYDIVKASEETEEASEKEENDFQLNLKHYEINNSEIRYRDYPAKTSALLENLNHSGDGDFGEAIFTLRTHTDVKVSVNHEETNYLNKNFLQLDAEIEMDLNQMKFTFKENKALVNQLALAFDGYFQINKEDYEMDLKFSTPSSDFKNFLALIPEAYASNLDGVETHGKFEVEGFAKGKIAESLTPQFALFMNAEKASFNYPDLPKKVEDISLKIDIVSNTNSLDNMFVKIDDVKFRIDQDQFNGKATLENIFDDMKVAFEANGSINLKNISQAYPMPADLDLNGLLTANIKSNFVTSDVEKERYNRVNANGNIRLSNFKYNDKELKNPYEIRTAAVQFSTNNIQLKEFEMKTGQTDIKASGRMDNLMSFVFSDAHLKGRFNAHSDNFVVADFMTSSEETSKSNEVSSEEIKIPKFLDIAMDFNAKNVVYDNLKLKNARGSMIIKNENVSLQDVSAGIFGGSITLNGNVSTQGVQPDFNMQLGLIEVDIAQIFTQMELAKSLAPIAAALTGKVSTNLDLKGKLTPDFSPVLNSLSGGALAQIIQAQVQPEKTPLINNLNNEFNFIDFSKLNLSNLTTQATFNDGKVSVKPFQVKVEGVDIDVKGNHNFDGSMDYNLDVHIPAKMLGSNISKQLSQLTNQDLQGMFIDVPVGVSGSFSNPRLNLNLQSAIQDLTNKIIEQQKNKIKEEAEDKIRDGIRNILGGDENNENENQKDNIEDKAKDKLRGLFGK